MKRILSALQRALPELLLIVAGLLIAAGVWMIYPPAGLIAAGVLLVAGVVLDALGERSDSTWV